MKRTIDSKYIIAAGLLVFLTSAVSAQQDTVRNAEQFIFPEFSVGVTRLKTGEKVILDLNYNIVTEKMVFMQKGQIYNIVNEEAIDTVFIQGRKFIPFEEAFYEVVVKGPTDFFIQHKGAVRKPPRPAAYGGTSQVSSSVYVANVRMGNDVYRMPDYKEVVIIPGPLYWIRKNNELFGVTGKRSLMKIYDDRRNEIKEFISASKLNYEDPEHIRRLVDYYNGLLR